ncbi:hypothetical protein, partial [Pseudomonas savastanoi]
RVVVKPCLDIEILPLKLQVLLDMAHHKLFCHSPKPDIFSVRRFATMLRSFSAGLLYRSS